MMELQTRLIRKAECNGLGKTSGGLLVGRRRIDEIVPSSPISELVGVVQIDEDVRIVFKWYFTFEKLERLIVVILLFTPLLFHTICKLHSSITPYGTPFILCFLLPNRGIQTSSSCAQLILLPIM